MSACHTLRISSARKPSKKWREYWNERMIGALTYRTKATDQLHPPDQLSSATSSTCLPPSHLQPLSSISIRYLVVCMSRLLMLRACGKGDTAGSEQEAPGNETACRRKFENDGGFLFKKSKKSLLGTTSWYKTIAIRKPLHPHLISGFKRGFDVDI
jgi:hypothetical protein